MAEDSTDPETEAVGKTGTETPRSDTGSDPLVRPIGYVEEEAVVRPIGDRELYLGNEGAADPGRHNRSFEYVLSVSSDAHPLTTHHRPLADGPNEWSRFEAAADTARCLHRREGSLLIHCTAGVSRSSALTATTLAVEEHRPFEEALETVRAARPIATPHPALRKLAVIYLAAQG
jgi:atypical dual specificity phosphatase